MFKKSNNINHWWYRIIWKSLCKKILDKYQLKKVIIFPRDEMKQFLMQEKFKSHPKFKTLRFFFRRREEINKDLTML